jgi:hypothetical protein
MWGINSKMHYPSWDRWLSGDNDDSYSELEKAAEEKVEKVVDDREHPDSIKDKQDYTDYGYSRYH